MAKQPVKKKLIKSVVEAARYTGDAEKNEHCIIWDSRLPGYGLRIYPSGKKSFFISYRIRGRKRRMVIGRFGRTTAQKAWKTAKKELEKVGDGIDPLLEREEARDVVTLGGVWHRYLNEYAPSRLKPRTVRDAKSVWKRHLKGPFSHRDLEDITRKDVGRLQHRLQENIWAANDAVKLLRRLYNQAADWELIPPEINPARFVKLFKEPARERYLTADELQRLGKVLKEEEEQDPAAVAAIRLILFTGARAGEILRLRWEEVDLKGRQLLLRESKTGPKGIELPAPAVEILAGLKDKRAEGRAFVFPGRDRSRPRNDYLKRPWLRIREKAELGDCRLHDLRHCFASIGAAEGLTLKMIGELLGHRQTATTERYSHLRRGRRQQAVETVATALEAAMSKEDESGEVVPFEKR